MTQIKRAYDPPLPEDGLRFLVERLWPRGLKKEALGGSTFWFELPALIAVPGTAREYVPVRQS
jgi:uncharacterized protein YeaO (DUF488 family)